MRGESPRRIRLDFSFGAHNFLVHQGAKACAKNKMLPVTAAAPLQQARLLLSVPEAEANKRDEKMRKIIASAQFFLDNVMQGQGSAQGEQAMGSISADGA
jgi:hypothetical protein